MRYFMVTFIVYICCFMASFWALSGVKFELFCNVRKPGKVQMLLLLLSLALGYLVAQFLLNISLFNGL